MRHPRKRPQRGGSVPGPGRHANRRGDQRPAGAGGGAPVAGLPEPEGDPAPEVDHLLPLRKALVIWAQGGEAGGLVRSLDRALDAEGVPRQWPLPIWGEALQLLARARPFRAGGWPNEVDARIEGLLRALLRFSRPDGSIGFGSRDDAPGQAEALRFWAARLSDARSARVVDDWFGPPARKRRARGSPPLPAYACSDRPLAMLRANWSSRGDWLAIDHRAGGVACQLELAAFGEWLLGPEWVSGLEGPPRGLPKPTIWKTGSIADLAEWRFRTEAGRVVRTALFLRGRQLALLADEVDTRAPEASMRIGLAPDVVAHASPDTRALRLVAGRASARVCPLALPALPYPSERGSIEIDGQSLVVRQRTEGKRAWLPLLVSWNPERNRKTARWRVLTVTERSTVLGPHLAFAVRVSWGSESLVFFRSLNRPDRRAFLGHPTASRFLVGLFSKKGNLEPLLSIGDEPD
jgi:hypothetical protein